MVRRSFKRAHLVQEKSPLAASGGDFLYDVDRRKPYPAYLTNLWFDGLTPSQDGSPSVSLRWATDRRPRSGRLMSISSEDSLTSPTVFKPAAASTFRIRVGNSIRLKSVSSESSGVGLSMCRYRKLRSISCNMLLAPSVRTLLL